MSAPDRPDDEPREDGGPGEPGRRRFLKLGATAGVAATTAATAAAASSASCATVGTASTAGALLSKKPLSARQMKRYLGQVDRGLAEIASRAPASEALPPEARSKKFLASIATEDALARKALRALYFSAMVNDLPTENRNHPGVQRRLRDLTPEIDEAVFTMAGSLEALSDAEVWDLQKYLKAHPKAGEEIAELIGGRSKGVGLALGQRMHLRRTVTNLTWRLQAQPPSLLVGEYVGKVKRVAARQGQTEELGRYLATHASSAAFWAQRRRLAALERPEPDGTTKRAKAAPLEKEDKAKQGPGQKLVNAGLILLGLTAASMLVGGILVGFGNIGGAFVLTAGAALLISGLIVLIIGAAKNASAS